MLRIILFSSFLLVITMAGSKPSKIKHILNGQNARSGQFPHQVSLRGYSNNHFCGGSILNKRWVLTAAHCLEGKIPFTVKIVIGSHLLNHGGTSYKCKKFIEHPHFDAIQFINDIALIQTATSMNIGGPTVQAIPLINRKIKNEELVVSGWGAINRQKHIPNHLQWIKTRSIPLDKCSRLTNLRLHNDVLCTKNERDYGFCGGDSGGPLIIPGEGLVGVVSFGILECALGYPDVFANVYYQRSWIMGHIS